MKNLPPHSFILSSVLHASDFLSFMLVPYAAFLLISEDMPSLSPAAAWNVWAQSKAYREACFTMND